MFCFSCITVSKHRKWFSDVHKLQVKTTTTTKSQLLLHARPSRMNDPSLHRWSTSFRVCFELLWIVFQNYTPFWKICPVISVQLRGHLIETNGQAPLLHPISLPQFTVPTGWHILCISHFHVSCGILALIFLIFNEAGYEFGWLKHSTCSLVPLSHLRKNTGWQIGTAASSVTAIDLPEDVCLNHLQRIIPSWWKKKQSCFTSPIPFLLSYHPAPSLFQHIYLLAWSLFWECFANIWSRPTK